MCEHNFDSLWNKEEDGVPYLWGQSAWGKQIDTEF